MQLAASNPLIAANTMQDPAAIRSFHFHASEQAIDDLKRRILATRWPDKETVNDASQGVQLATMKALVSYWGKDYDWRKGEAKLNSYPQFITNIDGVDIHHPRSLEKS
jgi:hypothetical protein